MEIYLIRHGIAVEGSEDLPDESRPLTEKGQQKTIQVAQKLKEIGVRFDIILTSPLVRARQTTDILLKTGLSSTAQEFADLAPEGNIQNWLSWLVASDYYQEQGSLALVGHQPDLGNWAEILVWGQTQEKLILKKAGVIALELPIHEHPVGQGLLFLLTSPKFINQ